MENLARVHWIFVYYFYEAHIDNMGEFLNSLNFIQRTQKRMLPWQFKHFQTNMAATKRAIKFSSF